jgi:hypothetical protein
MGIFCEPSSLYFVGKIMGRMQTGVGGFLVKRESFCLKSIWAEVSAILKMFIKICEEREERISF